MKGKWISEELKLSLTSELALSSMEAECCSPYQPILSMHTSFLKGSKLENKRSQVKLTFVNNYL